MMIGGGSLTTGGGVTTVVGGSTVVVTGAIGQLYPSCFPLLSFLQSPKLALTCLCRPPPVAAELTPTNGDPTIRQALAARDTRTRFALRLPVVERCIIIRGTPYPNPSAEPRIDEFGEPAAELSHPGCAAARPLALRPHLAAGFPRNDQLSRAEIG